MQHQQAANSSSNSRNKDAELIVEGTFECNDEDVTVPPKYFGSIHHLIHIFPQP